MISRGGVRFSLADLTREGPFRVAASFSPARALHYSVFTQQARSQICLIMDAPELR